MLSNTVIFAIKVTLPISMLLFISVTLFFFHLYIVYYSFIVYYMYILTFKHCLQSPVAICIMPASVIYLINKDNYIYTFLTKNSTKIERYVNYRTS